MGVVVVVLVVAAFVVTRVTTSYLVDQLDAQLLRFAGAADRPLVLPPPSTPPPESRGAEGSRTTRAISRRCTSACSTVVASDCRGAGRGSTSEAVPEIGRAAARALVAGERSSPSTRTVQCDTG